MFFETKTSINEDIIIKKRINTQKIVCRNISNLIFSILLSFIIELCNLIPLTERAIIHGIKIMFCRKIVDKINNKPFHSPHVAIIEDIV